MTLWWGSILIKHHTLEVLWPPQTHGVHSRHGTNCRKLFFLKRKRVIEPSREPATEQFLNSLLGRCCCYLSLQRWLLHWQRLHWRPFSATAISVEKHFPSSFSYVFVLKIDYFNSIDTFTIPFNTDQHLFLLPLFFKISLLYNCNVFRFFICLACSFFGFFNLLFFKFHVFQFFSSAEIASSFFNSLFQYTAVLYITNLVLFSLSV